MAMKERANITATIEPQVGPQSLALETRRYMNSCSEGHAVAAKQYSS